MKAPALGLERMRHFTKKMWRLTPGGGSPGGCSILHTGQRPGKSPPVSACPDNNLGATLGEECNPDASDIVAACLPRRGCRGCSRRRTCGRSRSGTCPRRMALRNTRCTRLRRRRQRAPAPAPAPVRSGLLVRFACNGGDLEDKRPAASCDSRMTSNCQ